MPSSGTIGTRIILASLAAALVIDCSGGGSGGGNGGPNGPVDPAPSTLAITTATSPPPVFIPVAAELAVGGTITWTNTSPAPNNHDLVATTPNWQLGRTLAPGESFTTTLPQAGRYQYRCTIHAGMNGTIDVR